MSSLCNIWLYFIWLYYILYMTYYMYYIIWLYTIYGYILKIFFHRLVFMILILTVYPIPCISSPTNLLNYLYIFKKLFNCNNVACVYICIETEITKWN